MEMKRVDLKLREGSMILFYPLPEITFIREIVKLEIDFISRI